MCGDPQGAGLRLKSPWRLWRTLAGLRGVTLESVEIWPQVNDAEGGVTWEAEVKVAQGTEYGAGSHPGD